MSQNRPEDEDSTLSGGGSRTKRRRFLTGVGSAASVLLAGCNEQLPTSFEATPAGFSEEGMQLAGYEAATRREQTAERSPSAAGLSVDVTVTSYLTTYGVEDAKTVVGGVLATPEIRLQGQRFNPLATDSLASIVESDRAKRLLVKLDVVGEEAGWAEPPTAIEGPGTATMLGSDVEVERFSGRAVGPNDDDATAVVITVARTTSEGDAVIGLVVQYAPLSELRTDERRRRLPDVTIDGVDTEGGEEPTADDEATESEGSETPFGAAFLDRVGELSLDLFETVTPRSPEEIGTLAGITVEDPRLVQVVDETEVRNLSNSRTFSPPRHDLVEEMPTTALFDIDVRDRSLLPKQVTFEVRFVHSWGSHMSHVTFERSEIEDILDGSDIRGYFDNGSRDDDWSKMLPVVPLDDELERVEVTAEAAGGPVYDTVTITADSDWTTTSKRVLNVGVWDVRDPEKGSNYGSSNGFASESSSMAWSVFEYLKRTFPGAVRLWQYSGGLSLDGHKKWLPKSPNSDFRRARRGLDKAVAGNNSANFPDDGRFFRYATGTSNSTTKLTPKQARQRDVRAVEKYGFDVTLLIVPSNHSSNNGGVEYYTYHNRSVDGLFPGYRGMAVSTVDPGDSRPMHFSAWIAAQEISHYVSEQPYRPHVEMAQRDADGSDGTYKGAHVDFDHARHEHSDNDDDGTKDAPGVTAVGYDLTDGRFKLVQGYSFGQFGRFSPERIHRSGVDSHYVPLSMSSYMSYDNSKTWTDAIIRQRLVESAYAFQGSDTTNAGVGARPTKTALLDAAGLPTDGGGVEFYDVDAYEGYPQRSMETGDDAEVELVTSAGEAVVTATVPSSRRETHTGETTEHVVFRLPFPERVVEFRTRLDGVETRVNPITRSVRDAVGRVPDRGLRTSPAAAAETFGAALDRVGAAMDEGLYTTAAERMESEVRPLVDRHVRAEFDATMDDPTRQQLTDLVDRMAGRLDGLADG